MPDHTPIVEGLLKLDPPKTWSLIATIFGDLQGETLSGKQLGVLLGNIGIKPEAIRVALHRLKQDGWIVAQKSGREVIYALSTTARSETLAARTDVYRTDVKFAAGWQAIGLNRDGLAETLVGPSVHLSRTLILVPLDANPELGDGWALNVPNTSLPDWVEAQLMPTHLAKIAEGLVTQSEKFVNEGDKLKAADRVSTRLLFLHHWRKLALRTSTWAHIGLAPKGILADCHRNVTGILANTTATKAPDV